MTTSLPRLNRTCEWGHPNTTRNDPNQERPHSLGIICQGTLDYRRDHCSVSLLNLDRTCKLVHVNSPSMFQLVLRGLIATTLPAVDSLLTEHDIELSLITLNWFLTLYASVVHIRILMRLWDLLLFEGSRVLFQVHSVLREALNYQCPNLLYMS